MRSPRSRFETGCRVAAFGLLGWLLGGSLIPRTSLRVERAGGAQVAERLADWTRAGGNLAVQATLPVAPEAWVVDWLAALRHSGRGVAWNGSPPALALTAEPLRDPNGGVRVDIAAPANALVA